MDTRIKQLLQHDYSIRWEQVVMGSLCLAGSISIIVGIILCKYKNPVFSILFPCGVFFALSYFLIKYFPKHYQEKANHINTIFPLIQNCIELFLSCLLESMDANIFIIHFLATVSSPLKPVFNQLQHRIQNGASPEEVIQSVVTPSSLFDSYINDLMHYKKNLYRITPKLDTPLENKYITRTHSMESRISISFFFGIFIPLGFSLGVFLHKIQGFFLFTSSPLLWILLYLLTKQITNDNTLLLGAVNSNPKKIKTEFFLYWTFFHKLTSYLNHQCPEIAIVNALESSELAENNSLQSDLRQFKAHSLSLNEFLERLQKTIHGVKTKMIFEVFKFMILTSSEGLTENVTKLLTILEHHQDLETQRLLLVKAEIFKVRAFQIILPISVALITSIFYAISSLSIGSVYLLNISTSLTELFILFLNQLLSVNISIYFFRKTVGLGNTVLSILWITFLFFLTFFMSIFVFYAFSLPF